MAVVYSAVLLVATGSISFADGDTCALLQHGSHHEIKAGASHNINDFHHWVLDQGRARLEFIHDPVRMSTQEMAKVDVSGMVKKSSAGITFFAYPDAQDIYVSRSISPESYWEKDASDRFCEEYGGLASKADFLDVGANIGTWSLPMARCLQKLGKGGSVIAVEALAPSYKHLAASIHANHFDNIDLFPYAVGEGGPVDRFAEKVQNDNKGGSSLVPGPVVMGMVPVYMTTLDTILKDRLAGETSDIFAMKMDIENFEFYALQGAQRLLQGERRPCLIQIELRVRSHASSAKAVRLLEDSGYQRDVSLSDSDNHVLRRRDFEACAQRFNKSVESGHVQFPGSPHHHGLDMGLLDVVEPRSSSSKHVVSILRFILVIGCIAALLNRCFEQG